MKNYRLLVTAILFSAGMMAQDRRSIVLEVHGSYTFLNNVVFDYGGLKIGDRLMYGAG